MKGVGQIFGRELRERSRGRGLGWMRVGVAAGVLAGGWIAASSQAPAGGGLSGGAAFGGVGWLAFALCLVEGARQTSDVLSRERREGTLGLLFLTPLSFGGVVLGKWFAALLVSAQAVLAMGPVLALCLLAGGVEWWNVARVELVLLLTLLLGGSWGIFVSASSVEENRSLLLGVGGFFVVSALGSLMGDWIGLGWVRLLSPVGLFIHANGASSDGLDFWMGAGMQAGLAVVLLWGATRQLMQTWEWESSGAPPGLGRKRLGDWMSGNERRLAAGLDERRPLSSVVRLERSEWILLGLALISWMASDWSSPILNRMGLRNTAAGLWWSIRVTSEWVSLMLLTLVATRAFAAIRDRGALEMLLTTPVGERDVVRAQWRAAWRALRWFALALALSHVMLQALGEMRVRGFGGFRGVAPWYISGELYLERILRVGACCAVGFWSGITSSGAARALAKTVLWIWAMPYLLMYGAGVWLGWGAAWPGARPFWAGGIGLASRMWWASSMVTVVYFLGVWLAVTWWASRRLRRAVSEERSRGG